MRILVFFSLFILCFFKVSFSQNVPSVPGDKPRLIVVAVIDQMRFDYLYKLSNQFNDDGFNRLLNEGTVCKNDKHKYFITKRIPA